VSLTHYLQVSHVQTHLLGMCLQISKGMEYLASKGENCAQRSCCKKLHVSTPTISELLLSTSAVIILQPFSSACDVSSVAMLGYAMQITKI